MFDRAKYIERLELALRRDWIRINIVRDLLFCGLLFRGIFVRLTRARPGTKTIGDSSDDYFDLGRGRSSSSGT